ncbi:MAG: subclass B3 metallo-beta-lactamase [Gemmatimonadetes bacterium]|nr:subclass B3 metallo-beta-lactamase [Gemmatimonadota bacterium]
MTAGTRRLALLGAGVAGSLTVLPVAGQSGTDAELVVDPPIECGPCLAWNAPQGPVQLAPRTWYVGPGGLSAVLIDSGEGLILLDGGLPQSAPIIAENIRSLGYRLTDIEILGLSHAHFDHAGGLAALQRASGARLVAREPAAKVLLAGELQPDDPQFGMSGSGFPPVASVEVIDDGWSPGLGELGLTAIATPGHTPGGTSWTWRVCEEGRCRTIAYIDSLSPVSRDGFRFSEGTGDVLRESIARIAALECDVFLAPHPQFFGFQRDSSDDEAYSCAAYAASSLEWLERRLESERAP